jgi:transcriptional regulator with XRE-family HTH domain
MSREEIKDIESGKRHSFLRERKDVSQALAAKESGISISSIQRYESGILPSPRNIKKIQLYYKCNENWLLTGEGEPYPNAGGQDTPAPASSVRETQSTFPAVAAVPAQQFNIMEDLDLAARVLGSHTHYAAALHLNIRSFSGAIAAETEMYKCKEDLRKQGETLSHMQGRLDELENQDKLLREEILKLKGSSGDSPPIALGMDHAAHTGTDDPAT